MTFFENGHDQKTLYNFNYVSKASKSSFNLGQNTKQWFIYDNIYLYAQKIGRITGYKKNKCEK